MTSADSSVWLVAAYSGFLLAVAYSFDLLARRVARRSQAWRNGSFTYHPGHDAWVCPQDQWLWPTTFDPEQRTMRYRAKPSVCNSCPVKADCTTSAHGREVVREVDPWPHSEAGRFHRGISCAVALIGLLLPVGALFGSHTPADVVVLALTAVVVLVSGLPLAAHLWRTPSGFPVHVPHSVGVSADVEAAVDRYATRWGIGPQKEKRT
jgi:hypothetical protein